MKTAETAGRATAQDGAPKPGPGRRKRPGGQSGQHGRAGVSRLAVRNWRVPARLTALILVPTVVGVILAGLRVVSSIDSLDAYQRNASANEIAGRLRGLAEQLGMERDRTIWFQVSRQQRNALADQRRTVDASVAAVRADLGRIDEGYGVRALEDTQQVRNQLDALDVVRDGGQAAKFTDVIAALLRLHDEIGLGIEDAQLLGDARAVSALAHAKEEASQQRGMLIAILLRGERFTPETLESFIASRSRQRSQTNVFNAEAGADNTRFLSQIVRGERVVRGELTKSWAIALAGRNLPVRDGGGRGSAVRQWFDDSTTTIGLFQQVEKRVAASVLARGAALESAERRNAITAGALILALILLVLATTVLIARSLVRPLRRLRSEALDIAGYRLPSVVGRMRESGNAVTAPDVQPILVGSNDEIGEVASAFDEVHRQALRLAAEESQLRGNVNAMFVNLSRRIQTLVERQISLIDGLERGEQDGARLADLFKLDHLATRMRRNSENLLVLAGHEAARKRTQPAKLVDVVRASLSEVEDYQRVTVKVHRGSAVAGHAANDVVHLIAELVENALTFSPSTARVVVSSSMIEGGGALLAVSDSGIGMSAEEIADVNRRLADPPVVDVSVSRRMGLFVVGRLALRHDIRVQLRHGDAAGLIAMVLFPPQLMTVAGRGPSLPQRDLRAEPATGPGGPTTNGTGPVLGAAGSFAPFTAAGAGPSVPRSAFGDPDPSRTGPATALPRPRGSGEEPVVPSYTAQAGAPGGPATGPVASAFGPVGPSTGPTPWPSAAEPGGRTAGSSTGPTPWPPAGESPGRTAGSSTGPAPWPSGPPTGPAARPEPSGGPRTGPQEDTDTWRAGRSGPATPGARNRQDEPSRQNELNRPNELNRQDELNRPNGPNGPNGPAGPAGPATPGGAGGPADGTSVRFGSPPGQAGRTAPGAPTRPTGAGAGTPAGPAERRPRAAEPPLERGDEYLPIFASVESAWFRRPDSKEIPSAREQAGPGGPASAPREAAPARSAPDTEAQAADGSGGSWGSTADSGWQAADAVKDPSMGGITSAGLPKRTPKANLVPGSVSGTLSQGTPVPPPQVSADLVRDRMSRFQQGIRRGRADLSQSAPDPDSDRPRTD
ncbi:nitrate- and nitrite sensing domain-containing protein [Sphaerisporangium sp. TRM90804]|uniref:sensor histidine kinase n=1 Tax=Sphaerisporangium sp. TRM90804 TaxID=3031113 RepID=UPI00244C2412|nr:nitrate- and nitrite sensing domain-containing protein [Sphaerisporangium sp. TRM90804]MDH2430065.1 nitrate- and nitrite sensing domain-containing protein [Sphaerisporangium sp. TRM90804]